jgi:hypothetical protein
LRELLAIYEQMGNEDLRDPRGHKVWLTSERFPHVIELKEPGGRRDVEKPKKEVELIRSGKKNVADFGGFHAERVQTLTWIRATISFPTAITVRSFGCQYTFWERALL